MRAAFPIGLALGEGRVITAFLAGVGALCAGSLLHGPWVVWVSASVAALMAALILVSWRRPPLATLLGRWLMRHRTPPADKLTSLPVAKDHRLRWTDGKAAIRAAGDELIAVVAVDGPAHTPSVLDNHRSSR